MDSVEIARVHFWTNFSHFLLSQHLQMINVSNKIVFDRNFCNGPDGVGRCQRTTFLLLLLLLLRRTSIGLVRTNAALLSLVDTN